MGEGKPLKGGEEEEEVGERELMLIAVLSSRLLSTSKM